MLIEERLNRILELLKEKEVVTIEDLINDLNVSKDTIRRDLIRLENDKAIKRTHGGAVLNDQLTVSVFYNERKEKYKESKLAIGKATSTLVSQDSMVILDAATTVETAIPYLDKMNIRTITNSLSTASELSKLSDCTISILPGKLSKEHLYITGADTVLKLMSYKADYALLGAFSIDENGVWVAEEEDGEVKNQIVKSARINILMSDSSKFNKKGSVKSCELSDIDYLVTDKMPEEKIRTALENNSVKIIIV